MSKKIKLKLTNHIIITKNQTKNGFTNELLAGGKVHWKVNKCSTIFF